MKDSTVEKQIELEIIDLTHEGKGVGRYNGRVVFVSGSLPGKKVICSLKFLIAYSSRLEKQIYLQNI